MCKYLGELAREVPDTDKCDIIVSCCHCGS